MKRRRNILWATVGAGVAAAACLLPGGNLLNPPAAQGEPCTSSYQCADGLACRCGRCLGPQDPDSCGPDGSSSPRCPQEVPFCYRACGDFTPAAAATCEGSVWRCSDGVRPEDCPPDLCWGPPGPGQVCVNGAYACIHGEVPPHGCITPDGCNLPDGGPAAPPACRHSTTCQGTAAECAELWCSQGTVAPGVCAAGRWVCTQGVLASACGAECLGDPPTCFAFCGAAATLAPANCGAAGWQCAAGTLRASCPEDTCWEPRPAAASTCIQGVWQCGQAGPGPGGGCLTPGACNGTPPACFETACCTDPANPAVCEDFAWTCGARNLQSECDARPLCAPTPDAGPADAALPRDASSPVDGGTDAGAAQDSGAPADGGAPADSGSPLDGGTQDAADAADAALWTSLPQGMASTPPCGQDVLEVNNRFADVNGLGVALGSYGMLPGNGLAMCNGDVDLFYVVVSATALVDAQVLYSGGPVQAAVYGPNGVLATLSAAPDQMGFSVLAVSGVAVPADGVVVVAVDSPMSAATAAYSITLGAM